MIPKNRIRLSRSLKAQISPYPEAGRFLKRSIILVVVLLAVGIYFFAKPDLKPQPAGAPKQILGEQKPATTPQYMTYKIKKGDTLFNLSQRYQIPWQSLADVNNLKEPFVLKIGQEIKVPKNN